MYVYMYMYMYSTCILECIYLPIDIHVCLDAGVSVHICIYVCGRIIYVLKCTCLCMYVVHGTAAAYMRSYAMYSHQGLRDMNNNLEDMSWVSGLHMDFVASTVLCEGHDLPTAGDDHHDGQQQHCKRTEDKQILGVWRLS